jgi:hypothetical protein
MLLTRVVSRLTLVPVLGAGVFLFLVQLRTKVRRRHVEMSSRRAIEDKGKAKACGNVLKKGY